MGRLLSEKYAAWRAECEERFLQLKKNEEELKQFSAKYIVLGGINAILR